MVLSAVRRRPAARSRPAAGIERTALSAQCTTQQLLAEATGRSAEGALPVPGRAAGDASKLAAKLAAGGSRCTAPVPPRSACGCLSCRLREWQPPPPPAPALAAALTTAQARRPSRACHRGCTKCRATPTTRVSASGGLSGHTHMVRRCRPPTLAPPVCSVPRRHSNCLAHDISAACDLPARGHEEARLPSGVRQQSEYSVCELSDGVGRRLSSAVQASA